MRDQTLNGQELVSYLIEQEQFEADINFPAKSVLRSEEHTSELQSP